MLLHFHNKGILLVLIWPCVLVAEQHCRGTSS